MSETIRRVVKVRIDGYSHPHRGEHGEIAINRNNRIDVIMMGGKGMVLVQLEDCPQKVGSCYCGPGDFTILNTEEVESWLKS